MTHTDRHGDIQTELQRISDPNITSIDSVSGALVLLMFTKGKDNYLDTYRKITLRRTLNLDWNIPKISQ